MAGKGERFGVLAINSLSTIIRLLMPLWGNPYFEAVISTAHQAGDVAVYILDVSGNDTYVVDEVVVHNK